MWIDSVSICLLVILVPTAPLAPHIRRGFPVDIVRNANLLTYLLVTEINDDISRSVMMRVSLLSELGVILQDEGWLLGVKESNGEKGVFPENFTQRL